ncbi:hypothetical protein D9M68_255840 [compost metagenome]
MATAALGEGEIVTAKAGLAMASDVCNFRTMGSAISFLTKYAVRPAWQWAGSPSASAPT